MLQKRNVCLFTVDDEVLETPCRRMNFSDLMPTPHKERSEKERKKTFDRYLLTSPECQKIIKSADVVTKKKEAEKAKQQKLIDDFVKKEKDEKKMQRKAVTKANAEAKAKLKAKKKVTCRSSCRGRGKKRVGTIDAPKI